MITHAFTCTGPYAILILLGIKRVENRAAMPVSAQGRCAISCSKSFSSAEYGAFVQWASRHLSSEDFARVPAWADVREWPGKIVGACGYSACARHDLRLEAECPVKSSARDLPREAWDEGLAYWWHLDEIVAFDEPFPCRGNVGMWALPESLARTVSAADEIARGSDRRIVTSDAAARLFRAVLPSVGAREGFFVLPLDAAGRPKSLPVLVSLGTDSETTAVALKDVLAAVFRADADRFIVAHNHPRGTLTPSPEDIRLTRALESVSEALGLKLLDHLVLGRGEDYTSLLRP